MKCTSARAYLFLFFILSLFHTRISAQTETITIFSDQQMDTNTAFMQGFVLGGTSFNIPETQQLKPSFWELGWDIIAGYDYVHPNFNTEIMVNVSTGYMRFYNTDGDPHHFTPWTDGWVQFDAFVDTMITTSLNTGRPVDYWVMFGEPDMDFTGTPAQFIEMHRRADSILTAADPGAKITGPDLISFNPGIITWFMDTLHSLNIDVAAVSWHEFGSYAPEDVVGHVQQIRDSLAVRPWASNIKIFIPEYAIPDNRLIPGWNTGWVYYFEKAKIDWSSHGCFDEFDGSVTFDDCFDGGLSGMYMSDGSTPQPNYWFYRAYAELNQQGRLVTSSAQPRTIALASKNDVNQEMKIIAGRYYSTLMGTPFSPALVQIKVRSYPYGNNSVQPVVVQRIPAQTVAYSVPLLNPITVFSGNVTFTGDSATLTIPTFPDGDVFIIYINADTNSVLPSLDLPIETNKEIAIKLFPNPVTHFLNIDAGDQTITYLGLYDITGKLVYQHPNSFVGITQIDLTNMVNGLYMARIMTDKGNVTGRKFEILK